MREGGSDEALLGIPTKRAGPQGPQGLWVSLGRALIRSNASRQSRKVQSILTPTIIGILVFVTVLIVALVSAIKRESAALQLRYLQTLTVIAVETNSTVIFPLPLELMKAFIKKRTRGGPGICAQNGNG